MTQSGTIRWRTIRPRLPAWLAVAGLLGLCIAGFVDHEGAIGRPWSFHERPGRYWAYGTWVNLIPFFLAPVLLLLRAAGAVVRRNFVRIAAGWAATTACFLVFMAVAMIMCRWICSSPGSFLRINMTSLLFLGHVVLTGLAAISLAALCAAPARVRLAASVAIVGIWSCYFFGREVYNACAFIFAWNGPGVPHPPGANAGLVLSLISSTLLAVGGTWETIRLWRAGEEELPRLRPTSLQIASWVAAAGMLGLCFLLFPLLGETARLPDFGLRDAQWLTLTPLMFAGLLLAIRFAGLFVPRAAAGQAAVVVCLLLLLGMDYGAWQSYSPAFLNFFGLRASRGPAFAMVGLMHAATLATVVLCVAPGRVRLAACEAVAGIWSVCLAALTMLILSQGHISPLAGERLFELGIGLIPAGLLVAGGIWQVILLRREKEEQEQTP